MSEEGFVSAGRAQPRDAREAATPALASRADPARAPRRHHRPVPAEAAAAGPHGRAARERPHRAGPEEP